MWFVREALPPMMDTGKEFPGGKGNSFCRS
jgi:hypothetical protein